MAYTTINKSTDHFNTKLWTGTSDSTTSVTGVGFQPDWTWIKNRSVGDDHMLFDAVRGVTKRLFSNSNGLEGTDAQTLTSFDSDGFTTGNSRATGGDAGNGMVSWNWKANGAGSANTDGDINSTVSANTTAGFSIVKYTGNGSNDQRVGHGLGARPVAWFIKRLDTGTDDWIVYHQGLGATQSADWYDDTYLYLNSNSNKMGAVNAGTGNPTTSVFYVGSDNRTNASGNNYIAYVFAEKTGYSKFGYYTGNGNADGTFVYTGFKPSLVIIKSSSYNGSDWHMYDTKRNSYNVMDYVLKPNDSTSEITPTNTDIDCLSNGFKLRGTDAATNESGGTLIYMAFGQSLVGSNNIPCTAR